MSFRNIFSTNSNLYQRLFNRNDENRQNCDEVIVYPNQKSDESTNKNFLNVENLVDYVIAPEFQSFLNDQNKVLILRFKTSNKLSSIDLAQMSHKCSANSIVILLATNESTKFHLYWKSKQIKHFLKLRDYEGFDFMNDIRLFEFLTNFLGDSLKRGHLGISERVPIIQTGGTALAIDFLADYRDFNLLLIAAEFGDAYIVEIMLKLDQDTECHGTNAQTLAWKNRHFEVLSILLKSNLVYPYPIYIDECPDDIQKFYAVSSELNVAILSKDESKVMNILDQNPNITHFYNLNNESALAFAMKHKLFDMYKLLISKNKQFGPHERFDEIKEDMKESELEKLREIHYHEAKFLPDNHMHILLSNSRLGLDTSNAEIKYKAIQNAFEYLNGNTLIQIILKIVAASRSCSIVFDFNRDSVEVVDPTVDASTDGLFYLFGRIYIGAKKLTDKDMKFEVFGVLAHELCHYAMKLVYNNFAKPYYEHDSQTKKKFTEISKFCQNNTGEVRLIDIVHLQYHPSMHHAELIVRVPHLIMKYLNNPEKLNKAKTLFSDLFEIYEEKIIPDMKKALPRIESDAETEKKKNRKKVRKLKLVSIVAIFVAIIGVAIGIVVTRKIFYKPFYKFSLLTPEDQVRVENAPIIYKHVDLMFHDLFPHNSSAYDLLTSDDISQMLDEYPLDFDDAHLLYLSKLINFEWQNLTMKLKDKFISSNITFQNVTLGFQMMNISNVEVLNSLKSQQIIDVLDGVSLKIHKMIGNETTFYIERSMFTEYIYIIYMKYMINLNGGKIQPDCSYKNMTGIANNTFEDFYFDYEKQNFMQIISETNQILRSDYYMRCLPSGFKIFNPKTGRIDDSLIAHKSFQKGFDEILTESGLKPNNNSSKIFILSADAGTGKTETFRQFALRIKRMYPTRWVSYIDYRHNKEFDKIKNITDAKNALMTILSLNSSNDKFEAKVFEEFFKSGRIILFWDGYDQISPNWLDSAGAIKILDLIHSYTNNIQFVSTRPSHSNKLRKTFMIEPYTFVPFDDASKYNFLRGFFVSQNRNESEIIKYIDKVQRIVNSTKSKDDFNTPLLLSMISDIISKYADIFLSENLYQLYKKFVKMKLENWLKSANDEKELIKDLLMRGISIPEFHQRYALKTIEDTNSKDFCRFSSLKLKTTAVNFGKDIKLDQISSMGIMHYYNQRTYSFAHSTFVDFFVAQYIILNIFKTDYEPSVEEAEIRIQTFYWYIQNTGVTIFIDSYFQSITSTNLRNFDPQILSVFQKKYSNFLMKMLQSHSAPIPILMKFFERSHELLTSQLQLNDSNGIYPSTFNYANFNFMSYDAINRSAILDTAKKNLTKDEYEQFIILKDHKGIILYSMYCVKQFRNSSEYARKSMPDYDLPDEIFDSYNVSEVLTAIVKNLTESETKKLLTSETVFYKLNIFNNDNGTSMIIKDNDLEFYQTLFGLIQRHLSDNEEKDWFIKNLKYIFLLEEKKTRVTLLLEFNRLFLDLEIYLQFLTSHILHYTAIYSDRFDFAWTFFVAHTNKGLQKSYLKQSVEIECYLNQVDNNLCYLVPKINLLQASLLENIGSKESNNTSVKSFANMVKIYKEFFNDTELRELIIKGSKEFIPFMIIVRSKSDCKAYADFLHELFKDNESSESLRRFLYEPVRPTKLNIFDLFVDLYDYRTNFVIFRSLIRDIS